MINQIFYQSLDGFSEIGGGIISARQTGRISRDIEEESQSHTVIKEESNSEYKTFDKSASRNRADEDLDNLEQMYV